jgi:hypothetical protein
VQAREVIARRDRGPEAVRFADLLLRAIELWKAGCIEEQTGLVRSKSAGGDMGRLR